MKQRLLLVLIAVMAVVRVEAQTFLKVIGDPGRAEVGHVALSTSAGAIYVGGAANDSALVVRLDGSGNVVWSRTFMPPGVLPKVVMHMMEAPDGTVIGCGSGLGPAGELGEAFHFRVDDLGNVQWVRSWDDPAVFARRLVWNTEYEYELFGGTTVPGSPTSTDIFNAQIDAFNGDAVLMPDLVDLYDLQPFNDDLRAVASLGFFHYGVSSFSVNGGAPSGQRIALSTFDLAGFHQESKYLIFPDNVDRRVEPSDIVSNDDSLTIAYFGDINGSSTNSSVGLIRCDIAGNVVWARDFNLGGSSQEVSTRVVATPFGYVLGGFTKASAPQRLFLMAVSRSGDLLWSKTYGPLGQAQSLVENTAYNIAYTGDGFVLTGFVDVGGGERDLLLIRTDIDGEIVCDEVEDRNAITTVLPQFTFFLTTTPTPVWVPQTFAQPQTQDGVIADLCAVDVDLGADTGSCAEPITLDAGIVGATYEWQDGSTDQTLEATVSGTYWVRVTFGCCSGTDTVEVDIGEELVFDLGNDTTVCEGQGFTLSGPTGTWEFLWSDNSTEQDLLVEEAGTIWLDVIDGGCTSSDTIEVTLNDLPTVDLGVDVSSCDGSSVELEPELDMADDFVWSDGSTGTTLTVETSGIIWLEAENQCGATRDSVTVTIADVETVDLGPDTVFCAGEQVELTVELPDWTLAWSDGSTGSTYTITTEGDHWLDATLAGCTVRDSIYADQLAVPSVDLGDDLVVCNGGSVLFQPDLLDVQEVTWSDGSTLDTLRATETGEYWVLAENICGSAADTVDITIVPPLGADLGPDTLLCGSDSLVFDLSATGAEVIWQDTIFSPTFTITGPGHYRVHAELLGCEQSDQFEVDYTDLIPVDLGEDLTLCTVSTYELDAGPQGSTAVWQDGSVGRTYMAQRTGRYIATITNYCGASADTIQVNFAVLVQPLQEVELCAGEKTVLDPVGDLVEVRWTTGDTADAIVVGEGVYGYQATDIYGCEHADIVTIHWLEESDGQIIIPTAFTPNDDDLNEEFLVYGAEAGAFELVLYDRWGGEVFRTDDPLQYWDGTSSGKAVPDGVYVYTITYQDRCNANNTLITERGHVTVLR